MGFDREPRRVLIASGTERGTEYLTSVLDGNEYDASSPVSSAAEARRRLDSVAYDIVIVNTPLKDEFGADFAANAAENGVSGVILIVKNEIFDQISYKTEDSGVIVLSKPLSGNMIMQAIHIASALHARACQGKRKKMNPCRSVWTKSGLFNTPNGCLSRSSVWTRITRIDLSKNRLWI